MKHNKFKRYYKHLLFCQLVLFGLICSAQIALAASDAPGTGKVKKDIIKDSKEELKIRKFWDIGIIRNIIIVNGKEYSYSWKEEGTPFVYVKPGDSVSVQCQYFMETLPKVQVIPSDAEKWGSGLGFWIEVELRSIKGQLIMEHECSDTLPKFTYDEVKDWNPLGKKYGWFCGFNWYPKDEDIGTYRAGSVVDSKWDIEETDEGNNGYLQLPYLVVYNEVPPDAYKVKIDLPKQNQNLPLNEDYTFAMSNIEVYWPPSQVDVLLQRYDKEKAEWVDASVYPNPKENVGYWDSLSPPNIAGDYRLQAKSFYNGVLKGTTDWRYFSVGELKIDDDLFKLGVSKAPDLVVDKFWVETISPGEQMLDGKTADKKYLYFVWKVRNIGNKVAPPNKLNISCQVIAGKGECPSGLAKSYDVPQLWPKPDDPDDPSGGKAFWNEKPFPAPDSYVKYQFTAVVDPDKKINEINEINNKLVSIFNSKDFSQPQKFNPKTFQVPSESKSRLMVEELRYKPTSIIAGQLITLWFRIKNQGEAVSSRQETYSVKCDVIKGGPCPFSNMDQKFNESIEPGGSKSFTLMTAKGASAGEYRVSVASSDTRGQPPFIHIKVEDTKEKSKERSKEIEVAKRTDTQKVEKQIDLSRLKGSLEDWGRIKKVELKRATVPCSSCERILARVKEVDGKGIVIERDADLLLKKYDGKKLGKEEFGKVEKRVGEVTKGLNDLTSQRKTLIEQYNAELDKSKQMKTPTPQPRKTVPKEMERKPMR